MSQSKNATSRLENALTGKGNVISGKGNATSEEETVIFRDGYDMSENGKVIFPPVKCQILGCDPLDGKNGQKILKKMIELLPRVPHASAHRRPLREK